MSRLTRTLSSVLVAVVAVGLCLLLGVAAPASILGSNQLAIDFTRPKEASGKAVWSDTLTVTRNGLGWDGEPSQSRDGWIHTKPLALGLSWRPASSVSLRVTIRPLPTELATSNGQKFTPHGGEVYARFSPDIRNWSSWQALQAAEPPNPEAGSGRHYSGAIAVPRREREAYERRLGEYSRLDVAWKSDEEAAVGWILEREPTFFSKHIPFVGYLELLFETAFHGGQRVQSLQADVFFGVGGLHTAPKDSSVYEQRDSIPWRFRAR